MAILEWATGNPFHALTWVMIAGTAVMLIGIGLTLSPIPMIQGRKRRTVLRLHKLGLRLGLVGVTVTLFALWTVLFISWPATS